MAVTGIAHDRFALEAAIILLPPNAMSTQSLNGARHTWYLAGIPSATALDQINSLNAYSTVTGDMENYDKPLLREPVGRRAFREH
ncbi:MAG: hypothetical protein R2706_10525 [Acidimicrobiales bacterium]